MKKVRPRPLMLVLLVLAGIAALAWFLRGERAAPATVRPALTVQTVQPRRESLPTTLAANGNIMAWQEASVGSEAAGLRLTQVRANVGDRVRKGQVLAVLSGDTVRADLAQSRAALAEAEAAAAEAANNAQRARTLQGTGALSAAQINQYLTAEQTARARVEAARAQLQAQQVRLAQTTVNAPDSGIISSRTATVGAVVAPRHRAVPPDPPGPARVARRGHLVRTGTPDRRHHGARHRSQRRAAGRTGAHDRADGRSADPRRAGVRRREAAAGDGRQRPRRHVRARRIRPRGARRR